jgi:hypothetical protein
VPLVLGLLMSADPQVRARQIADLTAGFGVPFAQACGAAADELNGVDPLLRLPLAELAFPALRHRPSQDLQAVLNAVDALIHADGRISVFEYCLSAMLRNDLRQALYPRPRVSAGSRPIGRCQDEVLLLLSVLATDEAAFRAGREVTFPGNTALYEPRPVADLDSAWPALNELDPPGKEQLIRAVVAVIGADLRLTVDESELLRTVCALLHCPLPPLALTI